MDTLSLIIHVTAAAILVGPQVLLWFAVVPSTWLIEDERLRRRVTRVSTVRFGMLSTIALVALVVTGLYQFYNVVPEGIQDDINGFRWGPIFMLKMTLFVVLVGLILLHGLVYGRRVARLSDAWLEDPDDQELGWELERQRRWSFGVSFIMIVVSVVVLALGVTLGHGEYSYVPR